jgi:hypothetical protein
MKLAPDNKIYFFSDSTTADPNVCYLGRIDEPDRGGAACSYVREYMMLEHKRGLGLPNV